MTEPGDFLESVTELYDPETWGDEWATIFNECLNDAILNVREIFMGGEEWESIETFFCPDCMGLVWIPQPGERPVRCTTCVDDPGRAPEQEQDQIV